MIGIIDASVGNLGAFTNILKLLELEFCIIDQEHDWELVTHFILPGVGAFDTVMKSILERKIHLKLERYVIQEQRPLLGICVGAQILCRSSEEGVLPGLGWVNGTVKKLPGHMGLKVPHMGWNTVDVMAKQHLFDRVLDEFTRFYFLHSYFLDVPEENRLCTTQYGVSFASGVYKNHIIGLQFHPEKSHRYGIELIKNFCVGAQ